MAEVRRRYRHLLRLLPHGVLIVQILLPPPQEQVLLRHYRVDVGHRVLEFGDVLPVTGLPVDQDLGCAARGRACPIARCPRFSPTQAL